MAGPRIPLSEKTEQLHPHSLLNLDEYMKRADQQRTRAREMIECAQDMRERAAEMRKRPRLLP